MTTQEAIDTLWIIVASGMVFFMQLGFLCLEIGLVQAKNAIDTAVKNVADFVVTSLVFYIIGYGLMFGQSWFGVLGISDFLSTPTTLPHVTLGAAFVLFQICFAGAAVTIVAGGTAERSDLTTHIMISAIIAAIIYPIFGHWVWGNLFHTGQSGWLGQLGFIDFAGSSVVHGIGGWVTLAGIRMIGPRQGRYAEDGSVRPMGGNNIPMAALGTFILWFGWFGFNGGSLLKVTSEVGDVILKTNMAAAAGGLSAFLYARWRQPHGGLQALPMMAGALGGMVAITAGSFAVPLWASLIIGACAGIVVILSQELLDRYKLDDPAGAVSVHGFCGALGTILTGVFASPILVASGNRLDQIMVQVLGTIVCFIWAYGTGTLAFWLINKIHPIRVTPEEEQRGLNITEYDDVYSWLDHRRTQEYEATVETLNDLVQQRTKALQTEHNRLDAVLTNMADGLIVTDIGGLITLNNPTFLRFANVNGQVLGRHIAEVVGATSLVHVIEEAGRHAGRIFSTRFDLNGAHYQASARSVIDGATATGTVTVIRDVTTEIKAEQSRMDFISNVSHELRTPLTSVIGFSKVIRNLFTQELTPKLQTIQAETQEITATIEEDLDILGEESERLNRLINDVLDISRMDAGSINWRTEPVDLIDMINQITALFSAMATEHNLELIVNAPAQFPKLETDPDRLKQVLSNLTSNAIKFTTHGSIVIGLQALNPGERIVLSAGSYSPDAMNEWSLFLSGVKRSWAVLTVTDSGIGIPTSQLPVIFERFGQVGAPMTDKPSGTGLGLPICLDIVQRMQGYLWVESEVGKGTKFSVALPLVS